MNEQLMAYLYGELSPQERTDFELKLQDHPELQEELRELQSARYMLKQLEDVQPKSTTLEIKTKPIIPMRTIRWMSIAAAVALLLWAGKPRLDVNSSGFTLAFGSIPKQEKVNVEPTQKDYTPVIQNAIAASNQDIYRLLDSIQQQLGYQIDGKGQSMLEAVEKELVGYQNRQKHNVVQAVNYEYEQKIPRIVSDVQDMQLEQRREVRVLLNKMWQEWQRQREQDLKAIENAFLEVQRQQNIVMGE